jgi:hypothetical protein
MQQMCKMSNRGSAAIELTIIMPVILLIIVMIIKLYMGLIYEGNICGSSYSCLYLYEIPDGASGGKSLDSLNSQLEEISGTMLMYEDDRCDLTALLADGNVSIYAASVSEKVTYKTEYDKCSSRLRRWQLYGDVIH